MAWATVEEIDDLEHPRATLLAMARAVARLGVMPEAALVGRKYSAELELSSADHRQRDASVAPSRRHRFWPRPAATRKCAALQNVIPSTVWRATWAIPPPRTSPPQKANGASPSIAAVTRPCAQFLRRKAMNTQPLWLFLHLAGVVVWVGGMFFAYCLPASGGRRLSIRRYDLRSGSGLRALLPLCLGSRALILVSGFIMLATQGLPSRRPPSSDVRFGAPHAGRLRRRGDRSLPALREAVAASNWPAGAAALGRIRKLVGFHLSPGIRGHCHRHPGDGSEADRFPR